MKLTLALILCSFVLSLATWGCMENPGPSTDSETHWALPPMALCESSEECEGSLQCLCGICTLECYGPETCGDIQGTVCIESWEQRDASCQSSTTVQALSFCMKPCEQDSTCGDQSSGTACNSGLCSPRHQPHDPGLDAGGPPSEEPSRIPELGTHNVYPFDVSYAPYFDASHARQDVQADIPELDAGPTTREDIDTDPGVVNACEADADCIIVQNACTCTCEVVRAGASPPPRDTSPDCSGRVPEPCAEDCAGYVVQCLENTCVIQANDQ